MANYSYSGNEYTDKVDGDIIEKEHVNDLQDEVEIVEGVISGGVNGQVLTADATGKANWEDAAGGDDNDWVQVGNGWSLLGGGNDRGSGAVDLQLTRFAATQVASGTNSSIGGGQWNTVSGNYSSIAGGSLNTISADYAAGLGGILCNISADYAAILGGSGNTAEGQFSSIAGGYYAKTDKYGQSAHASGRFDANGDAQTSDLIARIKTTTATPAELFLDGVDDRCTIAIGTTWAFSIMVVARRTDADNESAGYKFEGVIDNNAGTTALVGSVAKTVLAEDTAGWDCNVTADNTNDALIITATGENSKSIQWVARITIVETTG